MRRNLYELWRYRALISALVGRHLKARYRGSFLGFIWSFLNPLCLIAVYSLVFRYYIRFEEVEHYTLFLFAGLLPWIWFSSGLLEATGSISSGGSLIAKAIFPPHILPVVSVLTNLANFIFAIPLLLGVMLLAGVIPGVSLFALPIIIFLELVFITGLGLALSALNVHYRDIQHILGNLLTLLFFLCPIIYPVDRVPERLRLTVDLNPIAAFTAMYHDVFIKGAIPSLLDFCIVGMIAFTCFFAGCLVFNRYRDQFAELV